jgi:hypothetical protein
MVTNTLGSALGVEPNSLPVSDKKPISLNAPESFGKEAKSYLQTIEPLIQKSAQAEGDFETMKAQQKAMEIGGMAKAQKTFGENVKGEMELAEQKELQYPRPEFHPTQENAASLGALFSLVSTIGMVVGASGKRSATNAMNAMTGMLKGWKEGRKDLYDKEVKEFDKEYKRITDVRNEIQKKLEKSIQLQTIDKDGANLAAQEAAALFGANSVGQNIINTKGVAKAIEYLNAGYNLDAQYKKIESDAKTRAEERLTRLKIAELRSGGGGAGAKITAKAVEGYRSRLILNEDLNELKRDLSDPEMVNLLKKYRIEAFLTEEGKALNQVINSEIPDKLQTFLTKVRDIRNNYYLDISGKAVTGGEALRSYGTVPQPGDDARNMLNKIDGMQKRVGNQISFDQQLYQFPNIKISGGQPTGLVPNEVYKSGDSGYQVGQIISSDNKKYRIVNINDPSNPEIEEVK